MTVVPGLQNNCVDCAIAGDHTLGGKALVAALPTPASASLDSITTHFGRPFAEFKPMPDWDSVVRTMTELGKRSRGIVYIGRPGGAVGHVINVVHDRNGVVFLDAQSGDFAELERFSTLRLLITQEGSRWSNLRRRVTSRRTR